MLPQPLANDQLQRLNEATRGYSAASFAALRSELKARARRTEGRLDLNAILAVVANQLPPAIEATRRYQTLQALVNCTRRSLLPDPGVTEEQRQGWQAELGRLEVSVLR